MNDTYCRIQSINTSVYLLYSVLVHQFREFYVVGKSRISNLACSLEPQFYCRSEKYSPRQIIGLTLNVPAKFVFVVSANRDGVL